MHVQNKYSWIKHVDFIALNLVSLIVAFMLSFYLKFGSLHLMRTASWESLLVIICFINIIITLILNPYSGILRRPHYIDAFKLFMLTAYSFIVVAVFFYLFKIGAVYSRATLLLTYVIYYFLSLALLCIRKRAILCGKIQVFNVRERKLLAIINYEALDEVIENISTSDVKEYEIVGYCFPKGGCKQAEIDGRVPVIRKDKVVDYVLNNHIDDVYISVPLTEFDATSYKAFVDNGVNVQIDIDNLTGIQTDDQFISSVGAFKTLSVGPYAMDSGQAFYLIIKRGLDIIFGLLGCIILIPVAAFIKIAYLITGDTAPIIYTHKRIGQFGKPFELYKFRSMVPDADKQLKELLKIEKYRKQWDKNQKIDDDPRITPIGKFLRRTSLDEIPQFINILKGEMSLVGPRPLVEGELEEHNGLTLYNKVKPGITGWWACNGRSNISYKERLELEYYYVKNCSLYLDALCIFRTIIRVIQGEGAQ